MATPGLKRLKRELRNAMRTAEEDPSIQVCIDGDSLAEWHFIITGSVDTVYTGGLYWGKMVFPEEYPVRPPAVYFFTPNGRYDIDTRLCLHGISDFHSEDWNPAISIVGLLRSVRHSMRDESVGIGSIQESNEQRRVYAQQSLQWNSHRPAFCRLFPAYVVGSDSAIDVESPTTASASPSLISDCTNPKELSGSVGVEECTNEVAQLKASQIRDLCRLLGHGFEGPTEIEAARRHGVDALLAVMTEANRETDDAHGASLDGVARPEITAAAFDADKQRRTQDALFELILKKDLKGIDRLCTADPLLIHAVRAEDGKTPTIVAAIRNFSDGVWYFVERGGAFKHHSPGNTGYNGHHVAELISCEDALEGLARLGEGGGMPWRASEIILRLTHASAVSTALGVPLPDRGGANVPLPRRGRYFGSAFVLRKLQSLVDGYNEQGTPDQRRQMQINVTRLCRILLDLALTYTDDMTSIFLCNGGVETYARILEISIVDDDELGVRHCCRRLHLMALTTLHVCLHVMKAVRGNNTTLLDKMLSARMPQVLMTIVCKCNEVVTPSANDTTAFQMHAQRTCAAAFQSLTEVTFNTFEPNVLTVSFPEETVIQLVTNVVVDSENQQPRPYFLADRACSEMLAWWVTNLLDAGLFTSVSETRSWAHRVGAAILKIHPNLSKAECLEEVASDYGKTSVARAACDGNVSTLLATLDSDPDAMFEPNNIGQPALIAAASTGNKSVCDCIIALVERGSALKYHENLPNRGRHHITKFVENQHIFESLAELSENYSDSRNPEYMAHRARLIVEIRSLFAPPCMSESDFEDIVAQQSRVEESPATEDVCFLCTESMSSDRPDALLQLRPCGHWHHVDCAKRWLLGNRATCPRCDRATSNAWPEPPTPPLLPADGVKRAVRILNCSMEDPERCALALRILADSALTHVRRAKRIVELNAFGVICDACTLHADKAPVLYSAALVCLEVAINLKDMEYLRISMGIIATIRIILHATVQAMPRRCEEALHWEQVVERSIQVLAELSLSPQLPKISGRLLQLEMTGLVLRTLSRFPGAESIRMTEIFLVKVVMLTNSSGESATILADDCHAKAGALLLAILKDSNIGDMTDWLKLTSTVQNSRARVAAWLARRTPRSASTEKGSNVAHASAGAASRAEYAPVASASTSPSNEGAVSLLRRFSLGDFGWANSFWPLTWSHAEEDNTRPLNNGDGAIDSYVRPFSAHDLETLRHLAYGAPPARSGTAITDPTDARRLVAELGRQFQRNRSSEPPPDPLDNDVD